MDLETQKTLLTYLSNLSSHMDFFLSYTQIGSEVNCSVQNIVDRTLKVYLHSTHFQVSVFVTHFLTAWCQLATYFLINYLGITYPQKII